MPKTKYFLTALILTLFLDSNFSFGQDIINPLKTNLVIEYGDDSIQIFKIGIPPLDTLGFFQETYFEIVKQNLVPSFLQFEPGGTETNVFILDFYKNYDEIKMWNEGDYLKRIDFGNGYGNGGLLEISDLKPGKYRISYGSCSIAGEYIMQLKNE